MFPFPFAFFGAAAPPPELELIDNDFAMEFNGSDEYISAPTSSDLEITGNITISAWIKTSVGSSFQKIINKRDAGGTNYDFYLDNSATPKLRFYDGSTAASSTGTITLSSWNHVAISIDSGTATFYINGAASGTQSFSITSNDAPLYIAKYYSGEFFAGDIDEVAIWNRALELADIQTIYNATNNNPGKCANLWSGGLGTGLVYWNRMGD
jgi:hypothetical protein